jgi:hypothetical protein
MDSSIQIHAVKASDAEVVLDDAENAHEVRRNSESPARDLDACYQPLKEPVYDNHRLIAPDGRVLCRCAMKKVNWYVSRGLATIVSVDKEGSHTAQLKFEPAGSGEHGDAYQLADKHNHCVVCGRDDYNTKHHIVEYEYRQHMPLEYKSHNSYDLMILCGPCHERYELEAMRLKQVLAKKYDAPVNGKGWYHDAALGKVKKAAKALLTCSDVMPATRLSELQLAIRTHLGLPNTHVLTIEELQLVSDIDPVIRTAQYLSHGQAVVSCLSTPELQTEFIQMWRQHFVQTMQPQFLHPLWLVDRGKSEFRPIGKDIATSSDQT